MVALTPTLSQREREKGGRDRREHAVEILNYLIIPEAQDPISLSLDKVSARAIIFAGFGMLPAVQFNHQPLGKAGEVHEVWANWHLGAPFERQHLFAKRAQQALLGVG